MLDDKFHLFKEAVLNNEYSNLESYMGISLAPPSEAQSNQILLR